MSTKIYVAARCLREDFDAGLDFMRKRMWLNVLRVFKAHDARSIDKINFCMKDLGEAGFHVFFDADYAYFIPWGLPHFTAMGRLPPWLKDYAYWNNTDKPKHIRPSEWEKRRKTWHEVAIDRDRWSRRLTNYVLDSSATVDLYNALIPGYRKAWEGKFPKARKGKK